MNAWRVPIRIIGVGSPHGDDSVGWEVVRELRSKLDGQKGLELHSVEGGQRLLDLLDCRGTLFLIDALAPEGRPGSVRRFTWPDERFESLCFPSTHHLRPVEALKLAETLGLLPAQVVIFGIEAEQMNASGGLSQVVAAAVPRLLNCIVEELNHARNVFVARLDGAN